MTNLTPKEQSVYDALQANSNGDFACAEEIDTKSLGLGKQAFGALLTTLETKGVISVDITYVNSGLYVNRYGQRRNSKGTKVTQVTFPESN